MNFENDLCLLKLSFLFFSQQIHNLGNNREMKEPETFLGTFLGAQTGSWFVILARFGPVQ